MSLKIDFKDDIFSGKRRYQVTENDDGTISLDDVTEYVQEGDVFGAGDMNGSNAAINANTRDIGVLKAIRSARFLASGWSSSSPYAQTVSVPGISASDNPIVALYIPVNSTPSAAKAAKKAYGSVDGGQTGNGTLTLYCFNKKPETDITVTIKGG